MAKKKTIFELKDILNEDISTEDEIFEIKLEAPAVAVKDISRDKLEEVLASVPSFPSNYDDKVLAIEQGFKPAYAEFLARLKAL